jgi:hypothetical protein
MMRTRRLIYATAFLVGLTASGAGAQSLPNRVWVSVNAGMQIPADEITDRFEFQRFVETATVDVDYDAEPGVFFDGGVGVLLWKRLGAAVAFSRFTHDGSAQIDARIPHPFFDNRHREIAGTADSVTRNETGIHMQATVTAAAGDKFIVIISGGPSYLRVEQDLVTGVQYSESFPFDEATFTSADLTRTDGSALGFNAGADLLWMAGRQWGVGGLVRYSRGSVDLDTNDGRTISTKAGGVQVGAGIRLRF